MTQSSFDNVRRRCSPLLRSTDGRQSQRQRDYATVEATGEIDLERPWVYTDAEIADLAARVRWAQIDLAARSLRPGASAPEPLTLTPEFCRR